MTEYNKIDLPPPLKKKSLTAGKKKKFKNN